MTFYKHFCCKLHYSTVVPSCRTQFSTLHQLGDQLTRPAGIAWHTHSKVNVLYAYTQEQPYRHRGIIQPDVQLQ